MYVLKEILESSAIGPFSNGYKGLVVILFALIVSILLTMLVLLLLNGSNTTFHYGY